MIAALLLGCPHPAPVDSPVDAVVTGESMGGDVRIVVRCPSAAQHARCLAEALAARAEIERLHALATDWTAEGEVYQLDQAAGSGAWTPLSADVRAMLVTAERVRAATDGAFDVSIGALWGLWRWDTGARPDAARVAERLPLVDGGRIELSEAGGRLPVAGMAVTLGGIAQGYAAQAALARINAEHEALVDVSGDLCARGTWSVGVQHPRADRGVAVAQIALTDACLSTSGDYEKGFVQDGVRYHHILDPRTGEPGRGVPSATVIAADGAIADALATALVILGPRDDVVRALGAEAVLADVDGRLTWLGSPTRSTGM